MLTGCINNVPQKGRGLGHVTPAIFGIRSKISSKLLELRTLNLVHSFVLGKPSRHTNNCPRKGAWLGHVTHTFSGKRSKTSSNLLELGTSN